MAIPINMINLVKSKDLTMILIQFIITMSMAMTIYEYEPIR